MEKSLNPTLIGFVLNVGYIVVQSGCDIVTSFFSKSKKEKEEIREYNNYGYTQYMSDSITINNTQNANTE